MRLFELNINPRPDGGQCVLCGGSVRLVIDTADQPVYRMVAPLSKQMYPNEGEVLVHAIMMRVREEEQ